MTRKNMISIAVMMLAVVMITLAQNHPFLTRQSAQPKALVGTQKDSNQSSATMLPVKLISKTNGFVLYPQSGANNINQLPSVPASKRVYISSVKSDAEYVGNILPEKPGSKR